MTLKHLMVGVDLDGPTRALTLGSERALDQALWLAKASGARIDLIHAAAGDRFAEPIGAGQVVQHVGIPDWANDALESARRRCEDAGCSSEAYVVEAKPAEALAREASGREVDLVVIGKRDRPGSLSRPGSVARKVLRGSAAAVWAVDLEDPIVPRIVVAATDLSAGGEAAVEDAANLATCAGAVLHIVHAYQIPFQLQWDELAAPAELSALREHAQVEVERHLEGIPAKPDDSRVHIVCTSPEQAVLGAARELKADLVVVGTGMHGVLDNFMLGGTATRVLDRVESSLLTVRATSEISRLELDKRALEAQADH